MNRFKYLTVSSRMGDDRLLCVDTSGQNYTFNHITNRLVGDDVATLDFELHFDDKRIRVIHPNPENYIVKTLTGYLYIPTSIFNKDENWNVTNVPTPVMLTGLDSELQDSIRSSFRHATMITITRSKLDGKLWIVFYDYDINYWYLEVVNQSDFV